MSQLTERWTPSCVQEDFKKGLTDAEPMTPETAVPPTPTSHAGSTWPAESVAEISDSDDDVIFQGSFKAPAGMPGHNARPLQPPPMSLAAFQALKSGGSVSIFLDVLKNFINFREFSYACEKGFDVGGAVWLDDEAGDGTIGTVGFAASLGPMSSSEPRPSYRLHFTEGMIVMVPMPDFSMPFNVVALSSTAATFFFGSIFRMTAASHSPHWCTMRGTKQKTLHPLQVMALILLAGCAGLNALSPENMAQLSTFLSQAGDQGKELYDHIAFAKDKVDSILAKR